MKTRTLSLVSLLIVVSMVLGACAPAPTQAPAPTTAPTQAPAPTQASAPTAAPTEPPAPTVAPTQPPAPTAASAEPKILRIRLYGDIQNMDPAFVTSQNDWVVGNTILDGLVSYGPNSYDVVNELVDTITPSADGLTISFKLKEGVKWQKGYGEVTAEDVKFSFERIADPALKSPYASDWGDLDHVEVVDKYNGKIIMKQAFAPLWHSTLPVTSGLIVCKKYVEEVGNEKFATNIIGSGPYMLAEWKPKQEVVVTRNPDYYGQAPYWDEIHFIPIEDDKTAEIALEAGELDFGRISLASAERFQGNSSFKVLSQPSLRYSWIGMNVENPKLADVNVRQAIRYAIDVPSILKVAYLGQVAQETTLIPPGLVGYWKEAPVLTRDVAKAKEYLAKAGLKTLELRMDIQDTTEYRTWAEIVQQNLKDIGVNLTINPMDSSSFWSIGEGDKGKAVELFALNYSMQPDPSWAPVWFTCEQVGVWNWMRWCSKEYDGLYKKSLTTTDNTARAEIFMQMEKLWDAAAHSVFITHGMLVHVYNPKIKPATTPNGEPQARYFAAAP
jgi:peptide/nickel transport system substrate-binding protein